jgi:hypothetical protein
LQELEWKMTGPWTYALGDFGSVHAPGGVGPSKADATTRDHGRDLIAKAR